MAIARNLVHDHRRRVQVRQFVALGTLGDLVEDGPSPEERLLRKEEVGRLLDALDGLGEDDREIVSLRYGSGLGAAKSRRCSASARQTCGPVSGAHSEAADLITIRLCCLDFDGGGPDDDGLLVLGVPPDRVMMAALYEKTPGRARSGWLLR